MKKKTKTSETGDGADLPVALRWEASLLKLKNFVDGLVDRYSQTMKIEAHEAKDLVARKAASLMAKGQYGKAIDEFNRLVKMGKESPAIYCNIGLCCENEEMDEEAEQAYKKALEMDPAFAKAFYRLGLMAIKHEDAKSAVNYLGHIAKEPDASFDVLYQLGVAYDKLKEYENAIANFEKAIAADPNHPKAHKRLGYALDAAGRHEDAVACFKKAIELEEI